MEELKLAKELLKKAITHTMKLIYPPRCAVCDEILPIMDRLEDERYHCPSCRKKLVYIKEPCCKRCGRQMEYDTQEFCFDCSRKQYFYIQGKAVFSYEGAIKSSLYRFKYANRKEYADFYANEMLNSYANWILKIKPDALVAVPLHKERYKLRGYNQAEEIAKLIGKSLNIFVDNTFVVRTKNTIAQKQLTKEERKKNLKNAFKLSENHVKYNCILIVDDIYTTGDTINEIARLLELAEIKKIYFICVSIGKGY